MEPTPPFSCPICNTPAPRLLVHGECLPEKSPVYRCSLCGCAFFPDRQIEPDYWKATGQETSYAADETTSAFSLMHEYALAEITTATPAKGSLLDVGCGDGLFLKLAHEQGWKAEGLDASARGAELAHARSGCPVHCGIAETLPMEAGPWDVITLWDIIEHCPEPVETIAALSKRLNPGGIIAIRTPNENSFFRRVARMTRTMTFGCVSGLLKYVYYHPHYVTFSAKGLDHMYTRCGLTPLCTRYEETPLPFAKAKIRAAYARYPGHGILCAVLPIAYAFGRLVGPNKLFSMARKV